MTTDIAIHQDTSLTIEPEQGYWTDQQVAALSHMGVENAGPGDLAVFFHVVKRTGLDPFARQIHMIGRNTKNQKTNQWETKYTIQTGIDGYRVIGHRAADRSKATISIPQVEWLHTDGTWRPAWTKQWGTPIAARATIRRDGHDFVAVVNFDEYVQTKRDGNPTQMWEQRPAGQLGKCAEALAWRMAFPQDLAGVYVDAELQHADNAPAAEQRQAPVQASASDFLKPEPPADEVTGEVMASDAQLKAMFAGFGDLPYDMPSDKTPEGREARLAYCSRVVGRDVDSSKSLTADECSAIIDALKAEAAAGQGETDPWAEAGK